MLIILVFLFYSLYLSEAFRLWSKTGKIKPFLTKALQSHLVTENKKVCDTSDTSVLDIIITYFKITTVTIAKT